MLALVRLAIERLLDRFRLKALEEGKDPYCKIGECR